MADELVVTHTVTPEEVKKYVDIASKMLDFAAVFAPKDGNTQKVVAFLKDLTNQDWAVQLVTVLVNTFHTHPEKQEEFKKVASELVAAANLHNIGTDTTAVAPKEDKKDGF